MASRPHPKFVAYIAASTLSVVGLVGPRNKPAESTATGKPSRDRTKVKAARKQNRRRKRDAKKGGA